MNESPARTALLLALLPAAATAQEARFELREGGFVTWPWVLADPADPDRYTVWTAEDGARIRTTHLVRNPDGSFGSTSSFDASIGRTYTEIFRHVDFVQDAAGTPTFGIAVGDEGQWAWRDSSPTWRNEVPRAYQGAAAPQDLWETAHAAGKVWVVGSGGLIQRVSGLGAPIDTDGPTEFVGYDPRSAGVTLRGIACVELPGGGVRGIAVGDVALDPASMTPLADQGLVYWTEDGVRWHNADFGTAPISSEPPYLSLYDVSFVPGDPDVAYAVGGLSDNEGPGILYRTRDGGKHWEIEGVCSTCSHNVRCDDLPAACTCTSVTITRRNTELLTLYGVHAFADAGAVAVDYGAQILRRSASCDGSPPLECAEPWVEVGDNCDFANVPLWGVHGAADETVVLTGMFGSLRVSDERGARARHVGWDRFWRFGEVRFVDAQTGWASGQHHRIAVTHDGGATWDEQFSRYGTNEWAALDFHRDGGGAHVANGVAVGRPPPATVTPLAGESQTILFTLTGGTDAGAPCDPCGASPTLGGWMPAAVPFGLERVPLNDVACAGETGAGNEFWAVGDALAGSLPLAERTLVLRSTDHGMTWQKVPGPPLDDAPGRGPISWESVTFPSPGVGFLVGERDGRGVAYRLDVGSARPWTELAVCRTQGRAGCLDRSVPRLTAVDSAGSFVFAVGDDGGVFEVDRATSSLLGVAAADGLTDASLRCVEVVLDPLGRPHVFAGGVGGTVLRRRPGATPLWSVEPSRTSNTLTGMSFVSPEVGYAVGILGVDTPKQTTLIRFGAPE